MKIQEVEQLVGITKKNIRFYEHEGLLSPRRSENGYRDYSEGDVDTLKKIKLLRSLSFPIDEIRKLQEGIMTMEDGARRHLVTLERQQDSIEKARCLCEEMQEHEETLQSLEADKYLKKMEEMEKKGAVFMNIKKHDHRKDYIAPVIAAVVMIFFMAVTILLLVSVGLEEKSTTAEILFFIAVGAILVAVIVGVIIALYQRIKQIKGGEEDAAAKY